MHDNLLQEIQFWEFMDRSNLTHAYSDDLICFYTVAGAATFLRLHTVALLTVIYQGG